VENTFKLIYTCNESCLPMLPNVSFHLISNEQERGQNYDSFITTQLSVGYVCNSNMTNIRVAGRKIGRLLQRPSSQGRKGAVQ
jgi:hypothetical protein